jgi:SAM-dependent methyltransferase
MKDTHKQASNHAGRLADTVKSHYEKWPFPDADFVGREGLILLRYLKGVLQQVPERPLQIIDIGCGTGQSTIAMARHFPNIRFRGLDLSDVSVQKARANAKESGLDNINFITGSILDRASLPDDVFDLVISTGVLHHIENADRAWANLLGFLKPGGIIILWLYGRHGRMRHSLNQSFIHMLTMNEAVNRQEQIAAEFINQLGRQYAQNSGFYTPFGSGVEGLHWLLTNRQWLADQMIPPYERCYTMSEILSVFQKHEIRFEKWLGMPVDLNAFTRSPLLIEQFEKLSFEERLIAIDYLIKPEYYFVSGKKEIKG